MSSVVINGASKKDISSGHYGGTAKTMTRKSRKNVVDIVTAGTKVIWDKRVENTRMEQLKNNVQQKYGIEFGDYWEFHDWSVKNYESFWEEMWHYFGLTYSKPFKTVAKQGKTILDVEWFSGARLNYAENVLKYRDEQTALICLSEDGKEEKLTYAELYEQVTIYAAAMRRHGLKMGDRVACYMSNNKEALIGMLAATSIGAIWSGALPFYGAKAAAKILHILNPKFVFANDYSTFGKVDSCLMDNLSSMVNGLASVQKVIIVPTRPETLEKDLSHIDNSCLLPEFLRGARNADGSVPDLVFEQLPFTYPVCINFTSGTTGPPKAFLHSAGTLLPLLRDYGIHCNLDRDDVLLSSLPCGWTIWNQHVSTLALGLTLLCYDGCFSIYKKNFVWDCISKYKVTFSFFVTTMVDSMEAENIIPDPNCNLEHLKMVVIGASPVKLNNINYFLKNVKKDLFVGCLYGATELLGAFVGFDLNTPLYSAEIQVPALGLDLRCYDINGKSVIGKKGEMVIATPTPSFPVGLYNDPKKRTLEDMYLTKYPGTWSQHDEIWIDPDTRGIIVIGRSDGTIKQLGERFTPDIIYWAIHTIPQIADAICVQQANNTGETRAVLFVKTKEPDQFNDDLVKRIREKIMEELTFLHIPAVILPAVDIPYNVNRKKMESLVTTIVENNAVPDVNNIRNPECLQSFCNIPELTNFTDDFIAKPSF